MKKKMSVISLFSVVLLTLFVVACDSDGDARRLSNLITVADAGFTEIVINGDTETVIETGQSTQLSLTAFTEDNLIGTVVNVTSADWSSSDINIAEVDSDGTVFGRSLDGEVSITARFGGLTATTQVRVSSAQLESIIIQPPAAALNECSANQFVALGVFEGEAEQRDITDAVVWSVAQPTALFDATGLLRVTSTDELSVTATRAAFLDRVEVTQTDTVTVLEGLESLEIVPDAGELAVRSPLQYRAFPVYTGLPDVRPEITDNVEWDIEDAATSGDFAQVDDKGLVTVDRAGDGVLQVNCMGTGVVQSLNISAAGSGEFAELVISVANNSAREFPLQVVWEGEEITIQLAATALFLDQEGGEDVTSDSDTEWLIGSVSNTVSDNIFSLGNDGNDRGELVIRGVGSVTLTATFTDDDGTPFPDTVTVNSE